MTESLISIGKLAGRVKPLGLLCRWDMENEELIEGMALAILNDDRGAAGFPWVRSRDDIADSDGYVRNVRAAIEYLCTMGWAIVPVEATPYMEDAAYPKWGLIATPSDIWSAMIQASMDE